MSETINSYLLFVIYQRGREREEREELFSLLKFNVNYDF